MYILTWKCASRHNGVHFFISHLARCLRTRRFSEPTFRPSGATNHWKNTVNRDFPTFSRICIFFLLIFSLLTLLTSAFQLSILSEVSLLNFLRPLKVMRSKQMQTACLYFQNASMDLIKLLHMRWVQVLCQHFQQVIIWHTLHRALIGPLMPNVLHHLVPWAVQFMCFKARFKAVLELQDAVEKP